MAEIESNELQEIIRYRDAWGHLQEIKVTSSDARNIASIRRASRREQAKWESRHRSFTDLEIPDGQVSEAKAKLPPRDLGNAWEGPRFRFTWLVGESRTWNGEPTFELEGEVYCSFCLGAKLPGFAYCLGCDASGMDQRLSAVTPKEETEARRDGTLRGGLEGKR